MSTDLWSSSFGDAYHWRNASAGQGRWPFWRDFYNRWPVQSVLEVGCGVGVNLRWAVPPKVVGVDVNEAAVLAAKALVPRATVLVASASRLPFDDRSYELVVACGVLIHQSPHELPKVLDEMYRASSRYLLAIEYRSEQETEWEYRGRRGALWSRPYDRIIPDRLALTEVERGVLGPPDWEDRREWWLWQK